MASVAPDQVAQATEDDFSVEAAFIALVHGAHAATTVSTPNDSSSRSTPLTDHAGVISPGTSNLSSPPRDACARTQPQPWSNGVPHLESIVRGRTELSYEIGDRTTTHTLQTWVAEHLSPEELRLQDTDNNATLAHHDASSPPFSFGPRATTWVESNLSLERWLVGCAAGQLRQATTATPVPSCFSSHSELAEWVEANPNRLLPGTYKVPSTSQGWNRRWRALTFSPESEQQLSTDLVQWRVRAWYTAAKAQEAQRESYWLEATFDRYTGKLDCEGVINARPVWKPQLDGGRGQLVLENSQPGQDDMVLDAAPLTFPSVVGCPIASQPLISLVLICRFFTTDELIAVYQTSKHLSAAASHPITFQHHGIGLDATLTDCSSFAQGPSLRFVSHIACAWNPTHTSLAAGLQALAQPNTPKLRALAIIVPVGMTGVVSWQRDVSLASLTMLHVTASSAMLAALVTNLPPSVHLLHISFRAGELLPKIVDHLVGPACGVTRLLFDDLAPTWDRDAGEEFAGLLRLEATPRIVQLHWRVSIELADLENFHARTKSVLPLTTARVKELNLSSGVSDILSLLPRVERLIVDLVSFNGSLNFQPWPVVTQQCLRELLVNYSPSGNSTWCMAASLAAAGLSNLRVLHVVVDDRSGREEAIGGLEPLFRRMPLLTELRLPNVPTFEHFHLLAQLTTLQLDQLPTFRSSVSFLASHLSALTSLKVTQGEKWSPPLSLLKSVPNLRLVQWVDQPWMSPRDLESVCSTTRACQIREHHAKVRVNNLVELICDLDMMSQSMLKMGYDTDRLPLQKICQAHIRRGYELLQQLSVTIADDNRHECFRLANDFYTLLPHVVRLKPLAAINNQWVLEQKIQMVDALSDVSIAVKLLREGSSDQNSRSGDHCAAKLAKLKCDLKSLDRSSAEFEMILDYAKNTHGHTHTQYKLEVLEAFTVDREGESERFTQAGFDGSKNIQLLWHGSPLASYVSILSQGLLVPMAEAPATSFMFGRGLYFTDIVSKSANNCKATLTSSVQCMLLCEVALGDMNELKSADFNASTLPAGKLSTKGLGCNLPDPAGALTLDSGVVVPLGKVKTVAVPGSSLQHNEFVVSVPQGDGRQLGWTCDKLRDIVRAASTHDIRVASVCMSLSYDAAQVKVKYLVKVNFMYRG